MQKQVYERMQETLYTSKLSNGLQVFILPKQGFHKTYATFSTKYGSVDNHFQLAGQSPLQVPDGIAHFLEHKMFEEPKGDIFATFATQGAQSNAYTNFERTTYLFSATENIFANLETLLHFVQNPYFTDENVEKEKGIITQEIQMYGDDAGAQVFYGLLEALYQRHPVRIDIAGTVESITQINKEMLYACYNTFYHPSNMVLFVVGNVEPEETMLLIRDNQAKKEYETQGEIKRLFEQEPASIAHSVKQKRMMVSMPKCLIGFKDVSVPSGGTALLQQEIVTSLMLDLLFSSSSTIFEKLYEENLITDRFGAEYQTGPGFAYSVIGGDTPNPTLLVQRMKEEIEQVLAVGLNEEDFERSRRKKIGSYLRLFNSPEAIANSFTRYFFKEMDFFSVTALYENVTLAQVEQRLKEHFRWEQQAVSIITNEEV